MAQHIDPLDYDEMADLVVKLVAQNIALERRVTQLECMLNDADETILAIEVELKREHLARAVDSELVRYLD